MPKSPPRTTAAPPSFASPADAAPDFDADADAAVAAPPEPQASANGRGAAEAPASAPGAAAAPSANGEAEPDPTLPLAELLVRLLEQDGPRMRSQSSLRRLLAMGIGRELDLSPEQLDALALAAVLGALGELAGPGAAEGADAGRLAVTLQLLSAVPLPDGVREAVAHQHERWDGGGPAGLREEQIPALARILAVARAAAALLGGQGSDPAGVVEQLQRQAGSVFDPVVVSVVRRVFGQRDRHGIGYGWGGRVAVVHPRELRALDLASRLHSGGYAAETAADAMSLRERLRDGAPRAVVLGAELPGDLPALVRELRSNASLAGLPVVVVDAATPDQRVSLLTAGADVCFPPEVGYTELKATLDALLRRTETALPREPGLLSA